MAPPTQAAADSGRGKGRESNGRLRLSVEAPRRPERHDYNSHLSKPPRSPPNFTSSPVALYMRDDGSCGPAPGVSARKQRPSPPTPRQLFFFFRLSPPAALSPRLRRPLPPARGPRSPFSGASGRARLQGRPRNNVRSRRHRRRPSSPCPLRVLSRRRRLRRSANLATSAATWRPHYTSPPSLPPQARLYWAGQTSLKAARALIGSRRCLTYPCPALRRHRVDCLPPADMIRSRIRLSKVLAFSVGQQEHPSLLPSNSLAQGDVSPRGIPPHHIAPHELPSFFFIKTVGTPEKLRFDPEIPLAQGRVNLSRSKPDCAKSETYALIGSHKGDAFAPRS